MEEYKNEFLGESKESIKKEWDRVLDKLKDLDRDSMKFYEKSPSPNEFWSSWDKFVELHKRACKCEEAYFAKDCGSYWEVKSWDGGRIYKVEKASGRTEVKEYI